ncbi:MAG: hypothetical protein ABL985_19880 [Casimicrobium sp.]
MFFPVQWDAVMGSAWWRVSLAVGGLRERCSRSSSHGLRQFGATASESTTALRFSGLDGWQFLIKKVPS